MGELVGVTVGLAEQGNSRLQVVLQELGRGTGHSKFTKHSEIKHQTFFFLFCENVIDIIIETTKQ